ncbi:kynurenine formamidase [Microcella putealis]|uniref:Kynurenine formamidase n=1 Tax=Microcella putealis TaxID=337005 RepID=A0A4Q7LWC3_9MICO|nr:cyclase family protein [Microcella putealis]RZS58797.1 kynurenine formamidase [Microcella putealis]TQM25016.1 kynurenine formamidase [Microcella putealis]
MLIDLSHRIIGGMTVFPGDPVVTVSDAATVAADGFRVSALHLGSHTGTHIDAPAHSIVDGATLEAIPLEQLIAPLVVLDARGHAARASIGPEVLAAAPAIAAGDIVAIMTGWDARFDDASYLEHPVIDVALADALWAGGVRVLGVDSLNPDPSWPGDDGAWHLPVHELWLGRGGVIVENLRSLDRVPASGAEAIILPLKLDGLDGAPVRAVARVAGER